jgi:hypothetical protein
VSTSSTAGGDSQQERLLARLRNARREPVSFADLRASGIDFPAAIVSELELRRYPIDRVYRGGALVGVRLLEPDPPDAIAAHEGRRRRRWPLARDVVAKLGEPRRR